MRHNRAKVKLAAGKPITLVAPGVTSAGLVEILGRMGFDAVFIDCEHGAPGWEDVENMVRFFRSGGMDLTVEGVMKKVVGKAKAN